MSALLSRIVVLSLVLLVAQNSASHAALSDADRAAIDKVERYINDIDTLKARFFQFTSSGEVAEGAFFVDRPGRMRIEYDPPVPVLIVADGLFLIYNDTELSQVSRVPLLSSPASVLLREDLKLDGDGLSVTNVARGSGTLEITVEQTDDPLAGRISLTFSDNPLALRKWTVVDAQGLITDFALVNPRYGVELDPELFRFVDDIGADGQDR